MAPTIDPARVTFHLIPLPKGVKGSRGAVFLGAEPAGTYAKSATKTFLCAAGTAIALPIPERGVAVGPGPVYPGTLWTGKKKAAEAMAWTVSDGKAVGSVLPAEGFGASFAIAADGANVVGTGERPGDAPSRALLWKSGAAPVLLANPSDAGAGTAAYAIAGAVQGGNAGGMNGRACMWRGTTDSFVSLHPASADASCVRGVSDSQQVGDFEPHVDTGAAKRAAMWSGTAQSFVDLTPDGAANASAAACAAGYQGGWIEEAPRSQRFRAWLWAGAAKASFNLHGTVGGDWTASTISRAHVVGSRLLLLGTVEKRQPSGGYNALLAEQACWWEYALG